MKITKFCVVLLLFIVTQNSRAQVAMGKWRSYFSYNSVNQIAQSDRKIYAVSDGALFSVDKLNGDYEFYSKISGLNSSNIARIEFDESNKALFIVYKNGNIDVLESGGITNIPDLYNKQLGSSKRVNQIQFYQDKAYLACDFGILVLNTKKKEIADTYIIGPNASEIIVKGTTIYSDNIYAFTPTTIFKADVNEPHLVNFEYWKTLTNIPGSGDYKAIGTFADGLIVLRNNKMYKFDNTNTWSEFLPTLSATDFKISNGKMSIYSSTGLYIVDETLNATSIDLGAGYNKLDDAEYDAENNTYYFAASEKGIVSYHSTDNEIKEFRPNGPATNTAWSMTFAGKKLFVVSGGRDGDKFGNDGNVMIYENGKWNNILAKNISDITQHPVKDFMNVAVDPLDNKHYFVTSYGTGLFEFKNDAFFMWHNHLNSTIQGHPGVPDDPWNYMRLDGAAFDNKGNLFVNNSRVAATVKILKTDRTWTQLTIPGMTLDVAGQTLINNQNPNQKWATSYRQSEIYVYDNNGTVDDTSDDKPPVVLRSLADPDNIGQTISFKLTFSIAQDKNGVVWVGTDNGPLLFSNTSKVFDPGYTCSRVKIPRNDGTNLADYLLDGERINAIAIDGANRKWIGTENSGVYLMSENGQETIKHFTVSNSPLLSNTIMSVAINPVSGEVYMGTGSGIISYQGDAADATDEFQNVHAYPNPVRENFNGIITISGLIANTQVKITDLNGNLICQTVSNGSIATWDGKNANGRKVGTGIYLAICVNEDGTKSSITKIMVIN